MPPSPAKQRYGVYAPSPSQGPPVQSIDFSCPACKGTTATFTIPPGDVHCTACGEEIKLLVDVGGHVFRLRPEMVV